MLDEESALQPFFQDLLFREHGVYTLFGNKPITLVALFEMSEEENRKGLEYLSNEGKKKAHLGKNDFLKSWTAWEKVSNKLKIEKFLIVKRSSPDPTVHFVFFVNILATANTLQDNYSDFRDFIGNDFHPLDVIFEIENPDSIFWNKILQNHYLLGLLLGYGKENARLFQWKSDFKDNFSKAGKFLKTFPMSFSEEEELPSYNSSNFPLPVFGSAQENESLARYQTERERIKKIYQGKDELEVTLRQLTQATY